MAFVFFELAYILLCIASSEWEALQFLLAILKFGAFIDG